MSSMMIAEFSLPTEWDSPTNNDAMMLSSSSYYEQDEDYYSATDCSEVSRQVFEQWQNGCDGMDDKAASVDDMDIMQVDEELGSNLLGDDIFPDPCASPTGPLEELELMNFDDADIDRFALSFLEDSTLSEYANSTTTSSLPFEERYKATLVKLSESMKRSQETRMSLKMKTPKTQDYTRRNSVSGVLTSIETSSQQLHNYLKSIRPSTN
jgi:hypothetical protein